MVVSDATNESDGKLRFACQRSGNCCRRPGFVYFTHEDAAGAAAFLELTRGDFVRRYLRVERGRFVLDVDGEGCRFFDGSGCTIHPVKPLQCRAWPYWPEIVRSPRAWRAAARGCPGMGQGGAISREELEAWIAALAAAGIPEDDTLDSPVHEASS